MGDLIFIGSVFCALISAYILLFKKKDATELKIGIGM
jgi:hypothetical protein